MANPFLQNAFTDPSTFSYFDQNVAFNPDPSALMGPAQSPPASLHRGQSIPHALPYEGSGSISNEVLPDTESGEQAMSRSSDGDEDKDNMTPAQSRRKAQNRAACVQLHRGNTKQIRLTYQLHRQRAFRERKERHVKDLEIKLKSIEAQSTDLLSDNERLRRELDRLATQNEILRATSTPTRQPGQAHLNGSHKSRRATEPEPVSAGPMVYSPKTFNAAFAQDHGMDTNEPVSHRIGVSSSTGERLLATGAAWDLIQGHELYRQGMVDLGEVIDRLREKAICDGVGPAFAETDVLQAIQESVGVSGDELI